jgi:hypothetical protein
MERSDIASPKGDRGGGQQTTASYLRPRHGQTKTGYYWVYLDPERQIVYYDWQTSRGHECLGDILGIDKRSGKARFSPSSSVGTILKVFHPSFSRWMP